MIKVEVLKKLLNASDEELKKMDTERLRTMLGVFRYFVRRLDREINNRSSDYPIGKLSK